MTLATVLLPLLLLLLVSPAAAQLPAPCMSNPQLVNTPYCPHLPGIKESPAEGQSFVQNDTMSIAWNSQWNAFATQSTVDVWVCPLANPDSCLPVRQDLKTQYETVDYVLNVPPGNYFVLVLAHGAQTKVAATDRGASFTVTPIPTPTPPTPVSSAPNAPQTSPPVLAAPAPVPPSSPDQQPPATPVPSASPVRTDPAPAQTHSLSPLHIALISCGAALLLVAAALFAIRQQRRRSPQPRNYRMMASSSKTDPESVVVLGDHGKPSPTGGSSVSGDLAAASLQQQQQMQQAQQSTSSSLLPHHHPTISNSEAIIIANSFKIALKKPIADDDEDEDISTMISNMGIKPMSPDTASAKSDPTLDGGNRAVDSTSPTSALAVNSVDRSRALPPSPLLHYPHHGSPSVNSHSRRDSSGHIARASHPLSITTFPSDTSPDLDEDGDMGASPVSAVASSSRHVAADSVHHNSLPRSETSSSLSRQTLPHESTTALTSAQPEQHQQSLPSQPESLASSAFPSSSSLSLSTVQQVNMVDLPDAARSATLNGRMRNVAPSQFVMVVDEDEDDTGRNNINTSAAASPLPTAPASPPTLSSSPTLAAFQTSHIWQPPPPLPMSSSSRAAVASPGLGLLPPDDSSAVAAEADDNATPLPASQPGYGTLKTKFSEAAKRKSRMGSIRSTISTYNPETDTEEVVHEVPQLPTSSSHSSTSSAT
ncbi:hypothetical protein RI367_003192 [Sorochytrium milnesiophthora]